MRASVIIPTRSRPGELRRTLGVLDRWLPADGSAEVIVVDNASSPRAELPRGRGVPRRLICLDHNAGAAARHAGALEARGDWLVMLDDDSEPAGPPGGLGWLDTVPAGVVGVGGEILLPSGAREVGGLPEVVVGCGAAVRREAFLAAGGFDASFGYYGEESDLCAKLIAAGGRVTHDPRLRVLHRRSPAHRDPGRIVEKLVRNEGVVIHRYAPNGELDAAMKSALERRRAIAVRENVVESFERGVVELTRVRERERRSPLTPAQWARLTGAHAAETALTAAAGRAVCVVPPAGAPGKHAEVISRVLAGMGARFVDEDEAAVLVVGTLAPGIAADERARLTEDCARGRTVLAVTGFGTRQTSYGVGAP